MSATPKPMAPPKMAEATTTKHEKTDRGKDVEVTRPAVGPDPRSPETIARAEARFRGDDDPIPEAETKVSEGSPDESISTGADAKTADLIEELGDRIANLEEVDIDTADLGGKAITDATVARAWGAYLANIEGECNRATANGKMPPWYLKNYVPANVRILAFRRDHPDGLFVVDIRDFANGFLGTATIYISRDDYEEKTGLVVVSTDGDGPESTTKTDKGFRHAGKFAAMGRKVGKDIERAETGAISRALGFLGYGAVAAIAEGEDVRDARDGRAIRQEEHATQVEGLRQRLTDKRKEKPAEAPVVATPSDETSSLRKRLVEYVGTKRIFSVDSIEEVFGPIDKMTADDVKEVGRKLKTIKSSAQWKMLVAGKDLAKRWEDEIGGTDLERLKSYLWRCLEEASDLARPILQEALDASNQLVPFDDIEIEGVKIVSKLAETVDLDAIDGTRKTTDEGEES